MPNREQRRAAEHGRDARQADQKRRPEDAPEEEMPLGETRRDVGGAGAPSGGQRDGRQGDQQGIRY